MLYFYTIFGISSAAGPAGWTVASGSWYRPCCWCVLDCHQALPALNLHSRTNVTAKHLLCCAFISFTPSAAVLHHALTVCRKDFLVSSAKYILCLHISPIPSSKLNILGHFRVICCDKKMPVRVLLCAEAAASVVCGGLRLCLWWQKPAGHVCLADKALGECLGVCSGDPRRSQRVQGSHQHMGDVPQSCFQHRLPSPASKLLGVFEQRCKNNTRDGKQEQCFFCLEMLMCSEKNSLEEVLWIGQNLSKLKLLQIFLYFGMFWFNVFQFYRKR